MSEKIEGLISDLKSVNLLEVGKSIMKSLWKGLKDTWKSVKSGSVDCGIVLNQALQLDLMTPHRLEQQHYLLTAATATDSATYRGTVTAQSYTKASAY